MQFAVVGAVVFLQQKPDHNVAAIDCSRCTEFAKSIRQQVFQSFAGATYLRPMKGFFKRAEVFYADFGVGS